MKTTEEPGCKAAAKHSWQPLGTDEAGKVDRCGNCLLVRTTPEDGPPTYDDGKPEPEEA